MTTKMQLKRMVGVIGQEKTMRFSFKVGGLATLLGCLLAIGIPFAATAGPCPDEDNDLMCDEDDNCLGLPQGGAGQPGNCDTDMDGYGNACDPDFNNNFLTNSADTTLFLPDFFSGSDSGIGSDMNCNGIVNAADSTIFLPSFFGGAAPGPSGLACAGTTPCKP